MEAPNYLCMEAEKTIKPEPNNVKPDAKKEKKYTSFINTITAAITIVIILIVAYFALTYLMDSTYNIDTLMTGSRTSRLP